MKEKQLDLELSLKYFFQLKDWKDRTLFLGGVTFMLFALYIAAVLFMIIPFIGWIIGCALIILVGLLAILFNLYLAAYNFEVAEAVAKGKSVEEIPYNANYSERIILGLKIFIGNFVYSVPLILIYVVGYAIMFVPALMVPDQTVTYNSYSYLGETTYSEPSPVAGLAVLAGTLGFYVLMFVGWIYQLFQQYVLAPAMLNQFHKQKTINSFFAFGEIWGFIKRHAVNLLINAVILFGISMVIGFLNLLGILLVFVCVGIIILPVIWAVGITYTYHVQAHILGQLFKLDSGKSKS